MQVGSRTPSGLGLRSGGRLDRMRRFSGLPESSGSKTLGDHGADLWAAEHLSSHVSTDGSARACGVGDCACIVPTLGDAGETSGPRIDRIPPTRPPWRRRQFRELKKLIFLAPSKCCIDLLGPVANRTVFKRVSPKPSVSIQVAVKAEQLSQRILHRILTRRGAKATTSRRLSEPARHRLPSVAILAEHPRQVEI